MESKDQVKIDAAKDKLRGSTEKIEAALTDHSNFT